MASADEIFDRGRLVLEFAEDAELLRRVAEAFDREYTDRIARLRQAIAAGDRWTLSRESHAFKGSVATFFANAAFDAASRMEVDRDLANAGANLDRFEREAARLRAALEELLQSGQLDTPLTQPGEPERTATLPPSHNSDSISSPTELIPVPQTPERIGRYRVVGTLGTGGYGTVLKGYDDRLDRQVAIKIPRFSRESSRPREELEAIFLQEARRVARLRHPNVVTVHDVGVDDGRCFIVAEYLQGPDLAGWAAGRTISWKEAVRIVAEVADGLAAAHAAGIVHRDVKPGNIIMTGADRRPVPVLVDFGLALESADRESNGEDRGIRGTPNYMSPEQARGENRQLDGRTDLYALGVVLYWLLTGRLPFVAGNVAELLDMLQHDYPTPPRQFVHHVPRDLERLCLSALAKDRNDRPTSAVDFAADLRQLLRDHEPPALNRTVTERGPTTGVRVLVVEDDEPVRVKLVADISAWGHAVTPARDGLEAWELFQKGDFQIVITDWMMPRLDGLQLVERIRATPHSGYVYIIMLTSRADREDLVKGLGAGADDFLAKPCFRDELDVRLRAGHRIAEMTRQLTTSNRRLQAGFDASARMIRTRLPDRDFSGRSVQFAWDHRPCGDLGGNLLQLHQVNDDRIAFWLIDVEGHGIPSALKAAAIGDELHRLLDEGGSDLEHLATSLRHHHANSLSDLAFAVILGCIHLPSRELTWVNAGQPLPLLLPFKGKTLRQGPADPPFGIQREQGTPTRFNVSLKTGDRIAVFSQGLTSAANARGGAYGDRRIEELAASLRSKNAHELLESVLDSVDEWRGDVPRREDYTALVIEAS